MNKINFALAFRHNFHGFKYINIYIHLHLCIYCQYVCFLGIEPTTFAILNGGKYHYEINVFLKYTLNP